MRVAGILSGTSVDGIDVAIVEVGDAIELVAHSTVAYLPEVRRAILAVSNARTHTAEIARLNFLLGELFAQALIETCRAARVPMESVELIGSHGQTVFHDGDSGYTLQIGEGAVIRERTGIRVVCDFRTADMAAGGKGAPLVPFLDYKLFRSETMGRAALNIGGIANITVIPAGASLGHVIAFDTGPGNMVMDALAPPFDRDGARARAGAINEPLLAALLNNQYYHRPPPKTAGREQYGDEFLRCGIDIATAAELTVRTIAIGLERFSGIEEVVASGGGVHNRYLMERLRALLPHRVTTSSDYGIDVDAKEAVLFAVLAYERFHGRPGNVPSATGAKRAAALGKIC